MNKKGNIVEFSEQEKKKFNDYILKFAQKGLRTLAICMKLDAGALATYDKKTRSSRPHTPSTNRKL